MKKKVLSILVDNASGVLSRVAGLFSRRGYNIDSLTVGETENPAYSRMTVVARGDDQILDQIKKQLEKLEDVIEVKELLDGHSVTRELVLITIGVTSERRGEIASLADIFRANIVDVEVDSVMVELTGNQTKINAFIKLLDNYEILELVRTGIAGLSRGTEGFSDSID
ncbi:MAG: acetolactate synthase small subunit [Lachnospiraceae bacterium]|nr:acetolactate synthase small subunit [Lachnospiraceae bacterium]